MKFKSSKGWLEASCKVFFDERLGREIAKYELMVAGNSVYVQAAHGPLGEEQAIELLADHVINSGHDLSETCAA